jgi:hypothetical protein
MNTNVKVVLKEEDGATKIAQKVSFTFAKKTNQVIVTLGEFYQASKSQPIVFGKSKDGDHFASVILGFESQKNVFVNDEGEWAKREYVPAYIRRYPFIFVQNGDTLALGLDRDSDLVNDKEGEAIFDEKGETTEYTNNILKFLNEYHQSSLQTAKFVKELEEIGILEDATAKISADGENIEFRGFRKVDEKKLDALSDEQLLKLVKSGAYKFIMIHLASLLNFENIAMLENK